MLEAVDEELSVVEVVDVDPEVDESPVEEEPFEPDEDPGDDRESVL